MRNNMDDYGLYAKHVDPSTKDQFLKNINEVVDWLYGPGETAGLNEYTERLTDFKTVGEPIKTRYRYYSTVGDFVNQFD